MVSQRRREDIQREVDELAINVAKEIVLKIMEHGGEQINWVDPTHGESAESHNRRLGEAVGETFHGVLRKVRVAITEKPDESLTT